jgi:hypothetical protein
MRASRDGDKDSEAGNADVLSNLSSQENDSDTNGINGNKSSIKGSSDAMFSRQTTAERDGLTGFSDGGFSRQATPLTTAEEGPAATLSDGGFSSTWSRQVTPLSLQGQSCSIDSLPKVSEDEQYGSEGDYHESCTSEESCGTRTPRRLESWKAALLNNVHPHKSVKTLCYFGDGAQHAEEIFSDGPAANLFMMADAHGLNLQLRSTFLHFTSHDEIAEIPRRTTHSAPP